VGTVWSTTAQRLAPVEVCPAHLQGQITRRLAGELLALKLQAFADLAVALAETA
jgi:hypothetical protein